MHSTIYAYLRGSSNMHSTIYAYLRDSSNMHSTIYAYLCDPMSIHSNIVVFTQSRIMHMAQSFFSEGLAKIFCSL
jgi:hypothetical protein